MKQKFEVNLQNQLVDKYGNIIATIHRPDLFEEVLQAIDDECSGDLLYCPECDSPIHPDCGYYSDRVSIPAIMAHEAYSR